MPYFRLPDDERVAYRERGFDLLETAFRGKLPEWFGSVTALGLCDMIGEATIEPRDFVPTTAEWEAAFDNADTEDDTTTWTDGTKRRQELFDSFAHLTGGWQEYGIGALRTTYFVHAVSITSFEARDRMRFGGFPLPVAEHTPMRLHKYRGRYHAPPETLNWLAYDAYLSSILDALNVSWLDLESATLSAFVAVLPVPYRKMLRAQNVPDALIPVFWRHDLEHWYRVNRYGEKTVATAKNLSALAAKIGYAEDFGAYLTRLEQAAQPPAWTIRRGSPLPELDEHVKGRNPPTLKASYKALADTLFDRIEHGIGKVSLPVTAPYFVTRIYRAVAGGGQKPIEFWQLCADIVYHLPILISRLPEYTPSGDPAPPAFPAAEGFRSAVRDRSS